MTRAADLLFSLEAAGYSLRVDGDKLLLSPASKLTVEERESIAQHKAALVWLLTDRVMGTYRHGDEPVEMIDVRINLGDGRWTPDIEARWEAFAAWMTAHNQRMTELWAVRVKKRKKNNAKAARKRGRQQKAFEAVAERGGYAM